jgi:hypothetical protein
MVAKTAERPASVTRRDAKVCLKLVATPVPDDKAWAYWEAMAVLAELIHRRIREIESDSNA